MQAGGPLLFNFWRVHRKSFFGMCCCLADAKVHFRRNMVLQLTFAQALGELRAVQVPALALVIAFHFSSLPSKTVEGAGRSWRVVARDLALRLSGPAKMSSAVRTARWAGESNNGAGMKKFLRMRIDY